MKLKVVYEIPVQWTFYSAFAYIVIILLLTFLHCVSEKDPDIMDYNLNKDKQILIIFGTNIPDTSGHQMTV